MTRRVYRNEFSNGVTVEEEAGKGNGSANSCELSRDTSSLPPPRSRSFPLLLSQRQVGTDGWSVGASSSLLPSFLSLQLPGRPRHGPLFGVALDTGRRRRRVEA